MNSMQEENLAKRSEGGATIVMTGSTVAPLITLYSRNENHKVAQMINGQSPILIAERDEVVRDLQKYFLGKAGFVTEFVADGEALLESARLTTPGLIVTEILIPKIDGLAVCRRLREDPLTQNIPVVIFSILNAGARAQEAGAHAFLRKPLVESVFVATIQGLIAALPSVKLESQWASQS